MKIVVASVPGVLPLVAHRDDVAIEEVWPVAVASLLPLLGRLGLVGITL